jgi:hypothetical protein
MRVLMEARELAVWNSGQHSGNTFSFAGSLRIAIGQVPDGPHCLQGIAEYTDGTKLTTVIRKSLFRESDGPWHAGWCNENLL